MPFHSQTPSLTHWSTTITTWVSCGGRPNLRRCMSQCTSLHVNFMPGVRHYTWISREGLVIERHSKRISRGVWAIARFRKNTNEPTSPYFVIDGAMLTRQSTAACELGGGVTHFIEKTDQVKSLANEGTQINFNKCLRKMKEATCKEKFPCIYYTQMTNYRCAVTRKLNRLRVMNCTVHYINMLLVQMSQPNSPLTEEPVRKGQETIAKHNELAWIYSLVWEGA
jgi:hypothetical protein